MFHYGICHIMLDSFYLPDYCKKCTDLTVHINIKMGFKKMYKTKIVYCFFKKGFAHDFRLAQVVREP